MEGYHFMWNFQPFIISREGTAWWNKRCQKLQLSAVRNFIDSTQNLFKVLLSQSKNKFQLKSENYEAQQLKLQAQDILK